MKTLVEIEGVNGEWFTIAGPGEGDRGVYLGTKVSGIYSAPVRTYYEEPGNFPGARPLGKRYLRRDVVFGVEILNDSPGENSWLSRDSEWEKAWDYDRDTKMHITTDHSGRRTLRLRLAEQIDVNTDIDPNENPINRAVMTCVAGDPFWYGEDAVYTATTQKDTRFNPTLFSPPWPWELLPHETLWIDVDPGDGKGGLNPTDQDVWLKWSVPAASEPVPDFPWPFPEGVPVPWERAPFTQWTIPDYSFTDPKLADRRLRLPGLIYGENSIVDTYPGVEQISPESGSQVWARMNGVRFKHPVPKYTKSKRFEITVTGCAPGQTVQLRIPRPWSRPWGLE
ncbi:hypothetical protein [Segniliparus rugosus]|uniref:Minor tail protein n=1 Tax=Segniliparus rugosus (strain ATCC BAA-974 / DSM 45345 / CCUG 50838 / CIP 108380 / JCM 13579 / CDC 945) TaxID=679197 RepID=E5XRS4_SEGRC|nr:hypothetical protein [Segniliparus rugosus]EFV12939.1 hypothetical protein HMPREF9336_02196 [Segniliparus rugosus ATCC BAA-974]